MDYTCENCKSRHTWDCDDGGVMRKCSDFELDESTLSSEEHIILHNGHAVLWLKHLYSVESMKIMMGL